MTKINLNIKDLLRDWQLKFFNNHKKYNVLVIHRRWWKTVVAILFLIYKALINKWTYWYVAPYRTQAKTIAWDVLLKFINQIPWCSTNISELTVLLPNWSKVTLFGWDNEDNMRGLDLKWVVLDEYAQMSPTIYKDILFPMINAHKDWWTVWIWTPKGRNSFYELYNKAKNNSKYFCLTMDIYQTWLLNEEQIKDAKEEMTDDHWDDSAFRQEMLIDWDVANKYSYYWNDIDELRRNDRIIHNLYDRVLPTFTVWDLWTNDAMCILFFQYYKWQIRLIDYYENRWYWFPHYKEVLENRGYYYNHHYVPHDAAVKELWTWLTRLETLQSMLWEHKVSILKRYPVEDWINAVRRIFPKIYVDATLSLFLDKLSDYKPKIDKNWVPWKPEHNDLADTVRYLSAAYTLFIEPENDFEVHTIDYSDFF